MGIPTMVLVKDNKTVAKLVGYRGADEVKKFALS
jgi:thioredoxin-like negative regulator of GroEL